MRFVDFNIDDLSSLNFSITENNKKQINHLFNDEKFKAHLFFMPERNSSTSPIESLESLPSVISSREFDPEEFSENENDWTPEDDFSHTAPIEEVFFNETSDYSDVVDFNSDLEHFKGVIFYKTGYLEFILPCLFNSDSKIRIHPDFQNEWDFFFTKSEGFYKHPPERKELFVFVQDNVYHLSLSTTELLKFNTDTALLNKLTKNIFIEFQYSKLIETFENKPLLNNTSKPKKLKI